MNGSLVMRSPVVNLETEIEGFRRAKLCWSIGETCVQVILEHESNEFVTSSCAWTLQTLLSCVKQWPNIQWHEYKANGSCGRKLPVTWRLRRPVHEDCGFEVIHYDCTEPWLGNSTLCIAGCEAARFKDLKPRREETLHSDGHGRYRREYLTNYLSFSK